MRSSSGSRKLALTGCAISSTDAMEIATALRENRRLVRLSLQQCQLCSTGGASLAEALMGNDSLVSLALDGNNLGEKGAAKFAEALRHNETLTSLGLGRNRISDAGCRELAKALEENHTLVALDLSNNADLTRAAATGQACYREVQALLRRNKAPTKVLTLRAQSWTEEDEKERPRPPSCGEPRAEVTAKECEQPLPPLRISATNIAGCEVAVVRADPQRELATVRAEIAARVNMPKQRVALVLPDGRLLGRAEDGQSIGTVLQCP